jgi:hypothetical protein
VFSRQLPAGFRPLRLSPFDFRLQAPPAAG